MSKTTLQMVFPILALVGSEICVARTVDDEQVPEKSTRQDAEDTRESLINLLIQQKGHILSEEKGEKYAERFTKASGGNDLLQEAVKSDDNEIRKTVASIIGHINEEWAYLQLVRLSTEDNDEGVREDAILSILYHKDRKPEKVITGILSKDKSPRVRQKVARWLAGFKTEDAVGALLKAAQEDESIEVQCESLKSLGEIGNKRALPLLLSIIRKGGLRSSPEDYETNVYAVMGAVQALGKIDAPEASSEITKILLGDNTWGKDLPREFGKVIIENGFRHIYKPWVLDVLIEVIKKSSDEELVETAKKTKDDFLKRQEELEKQEKEKTEKIRK